ncbi:MAG: hypothetical protein SHS37scaffold220_48 [Phage 67_12]|nr:MAG: hypothetical protein SHS37scaffold220_48 [Phage 67_12]
MTFYCRQSFSVMFLWPILAFGDEDGVPFLEFAFLFWSIGVGKFNG